MFQQTKAWQSYRQVATQTASPGQLVMLLYDGIIRFLEQARQGFSKDDPKEFNETINNNIQRAQAIINEMNQSLNMAQGGEFAVRLRSLYDYFDRRLQESNVAKTIAGIDEVLKHVTVLRDAWAEMLQGGAADMPATPSTGSGRAPAPPRPNTPASPDSGTRQP
jgi:flagellar protein FliS